MAFVPNPSPSEDNQSSLGTDLNIINTEDEMHIDTTKWTSTKWKKLQHMTEFHEEYQWIFRERASIHTIMKKRISHMNPPMPDYVGRKCKMPQWIPMTLLLNISQMLKEGKLKN